MHSIPSTLLILNVYDCTHFSRNRDYPARLASPLGPAAVLNLEKCPTARRLWMFLHRQYDKYHTKLLGVYKYVLQLGCEAHHLWLDMYITVLILCIRLFQVKISLVFRYHPRSRILVTPESCSQTACTSTLPTTSLQAHGSQVACLSLLQSDVLLMRILGLLWSNGSRVACSNLAAERQPHPDCGILRYSRGWKSLSYFWGT